MSNRLTSALERLWHGFLTYAVKFGIVGLIGLVIDITLFNLLRLGVFGEGHWAESAIGAKTISTSVAIVFNWLGNRYWTFRKHRRRNYVREFVEYVIVSLGGMAIALGCLWVSHYWLGYTSLLADNISTNVVGLALGTAFRFLLYRYWVFGDNRPDGLSNLEKVEEAERTLFEEPVVVEGLEEPTGTEPAQPAAPAELPRAEPARPVAPAELPRAEPARDKPTTPSVPGEHP